jgi:hypothetical protein
LICVAELQTVLNDGHLGAKQAQRLRGKMQFAENQLFGRTGRRCLKVLSVFAEGHKYKLQNKDIFFLEGQLRTITAFYHVTFMIVGKMFMYIFVYSYKRI